MFSQNLEEIIYVAAETFTANQNEKSLQLLNTQEATFKKQVKTKDEQLALVFLQEKGLMIGVFTCRTVLCVMRSLVGEQIISNIFSMGIVFP